MVQKVEIFFLNWEKKTKTGYLEAKHPWEVQDFWTFKHNPKIGSCGYSLESRENSSKIPFWRSRIREKGTLYLALELFES